MKKTCNVCGGNGQITCPKCGGNGWRDFEFTKPCNCDCGYVVCKNCGGKGSYEVSK